MLRIETIETNKRFAIKLPGCASAIASWCTVALAAPPAAMAACKQKKKHGET